MYRTNRGSAVVWAALIISIIALILAWAAYNRAGADLEQQIQREVEEAVAEIQVNADRAGDVVRENVPDIDVDVNRGTSTATTTR